MLPAAAYYWQSIDGNMRKACELAGYREIRTPVFEHTELFQRGVGDTTDVVQKEMYTFEDKGHRSITLKPEGTAGVVRALIEAHSLSETLPVKVYDAACPCFRYEKPQSGRLRQFHQNGVEVFGAADASTDAEVIALALSILKANDLTALRLNINSIGCPTCRKAYQDKLRAYLSPKLSGHCQTCRDRFERNPLRILDCNDDADKLGDAPSMLDSLCPDCADHFAKLQRYLDVLGIGYAIDSRIVRGLDYYTRTVFEIITDTENGPLTVCGGGRYDGLSEDLGGPSIPGIGFGMGIERMIMIQAQQNALPEVPPLYDVFVATMGDEARVEGMRLVSELRGLGLRADLDHVARSMKAQLKYANKTGAAVVVLIGETELQSGQYTVRDMASGEQTNVQREQLADTLRLKFDRQEM